MRARLSHSLRLVAAALVLAAAGCGSSSSASNTDSFVGTWSFASGSIVPNCSIAGIPDIDLTGDIVTISKIDEGHVLMSITGTGVMCDVRFAASDTIATADANQTCAITASGQSAVVSVQSWTLIPGTSSLNMMMSGTSTVSVMGFPLTCMPTSTGVMVRTSADAAAAG
jgi:hypothetical protein